MRIYSCHLEAATETKEFFYIGIAHTLKEHYRIIKIGTTNDLTRRRGEHRRKSDYKNPNFSLNDFEYVQTFALAKSTTLALESSIREQLREMIEQDEVFQKNDRFIIMHNEEIQIHVTIRSKIYKIIIPENA